MPIIATGVPQRRWMTNKNANVLELHLVLNKKKIIIRIEMM